MANFLKPLFKLAESLKGFSKFIAFLVLCLLGFSIWAIPKGNFDFLIKNISILSKDQFFYIILISLFFIFVFFSLLVILAYRSRPEFKVPLPKTDKGHEKPEFPVVPDRADIGYKENLNGKKNIKKGTDPVLEIRMDFRVRMTEAIAIYYENILSGTDLFVPEKLSVLTRKDWWPEQPFELKEIDQRLSWEDKHQPANCHGSQFDLVSLMKNYDRKGKLHDGFLYRYLGGKGRQYQFCSSSYYKFLNSCEYLSYELANAFNSQTHLFELLQEGGRSELEEIAKILHQNKALIPKRVDTDPSDFSARTTAFGTCALVVLKRPKKKAHFIINERSRSLSETPSLLHVIPAGTFQPNTRDDRFHDNEFSFTENLIREFTEEILDDKLLRGDEPNVRNFTNMYHNKGKVFRDTVITPNNFEVLYLGTVVDPINLKPEILTAFLMHEAYFDAIVGDELKLSWETKNNARTQQREIMKYNFTKNKLSCLIEKENLVPTGKAHLSLALQHYDYLISKLKEL